MFSIETTVSREVLSVTNYDDLEVIRKVTSLTSETALLETEIDESLGTLFKSIAFCFEMLFNLHQSRVNKSFFRRSGGEYNRKDGG